MTNMMKKIMVMVAVCAMLGTGAAPLAVAQTSATGPTGTASASVPFLLEFSLNLVRRMNSDAGETDPWSQGTTVTPPVFNFGTLRQVTDSSGTFQYMRGQYYYYALLLAATSGRRYKITETGTQLTGSGGTLARESVLLVPDYQWLDELGGTAQGAPPSGAFLGPVASATPTGESLVYQSDTAGSSRIIRAVVAITGPGAGETYPANYTQGYNGTTGQGTKQFFTNWKPVTLAQHGGDYSGTMTFTLVLN
ncbi:MAG: hypothetical protein ACM3L6_02810 [Deltaproteobacteria bacterium]